MPRRTKKTIRRIKAPIAKELLKMANDLDRINRRLLALAEGKVVEVESKAEAAENFMASLEGTGSEQGR